MEISYKLINRILMTNLYVKYIMAEYSLTKLSPILFTKITWEITIVSQNALIQLHRIKKLIPPKR